MIYIEPILIIVKCGFSEGNQIFRNDHEGRPIIHLSELRTEDVYELNTNLYRMLSKIFRQSWQ